MERRLCTRWMALLAGVVFGLAACAAAPVQEMSDARQSVEAARGVGAEMRAADLFHRAEAYLNQAEAALDRGDFDLARRSARKAREAAQAAWNAAMDAEADAVGN